MSAPFRRSDAETEKFREAWRKAHPVNRALALAILREATKHMDAELKGTAKAAGCPLKGSAK